MDKGNDDCPSLRGIAFVASGRAMMPVVWKTIRMVDRQKWHGIARTVSARF